MSLREMVFYLINVAKGARLRSRSQSRSRARSSAKSSLAAGRTEVLLTHGRSSSAHGLGDLRIAERGNPGPPKGDTDIE